MTCDHRASYIKGKETATNMEIRCAVCDLTDAQKAHETLSLRINQVLALAEVPSQLGPALAEMGDDDHAVWNRGWSAAIRFFRAHFQADGGSEHGKG